MQRRISGELGAFDYWDACSTAREQYREAVRLSISGSQKRYLAQDLGARCADMLHLVEDGIQRALEYADGVIPTYFIFEPTKFDVLKHEDGQPQLAACGLPKITVQGFTPRALPAFLEGPVKLMGVTTQPQQALALHQCVQSSALYDQALGMYKTSVSLQQEPMAIGRIRAFTPGWQERESIFLHMHYKYLLAMLQAGLYQPFFEQMQTTWLPFRDAHTYGRSPLENSSFLASSVNPDASLHGRGFVARLTGSTTEVLSIWALMMVGQTWFTQEQGRLCFTLAPILPDFLFDDQNKVTFRLLSSCDVTYHNPRRVPTYGTDAARPVRITLYHDGGQQTIAGSVLPQEWAQRLRQGQIHRMYVELA